MLVIVIVFLAAFLVYAFFGDKISSLFEKTDKPSVEDVTPAPSPTPDTSVTLTLDQQTLTLVEGGSNEADRLRRGKLHLDEQQHRRGHRL